MLNYPTRNTDANMRYYALDMIMNIHSDASYLSEWGACSKACGHSFMGWMPQNGQPIKLKSVTHTSLPTVASAIEAELGALFYNCQRGIFFGLHWLT